jgi:hypothetical protein
MIRVSLGSRSSRVWRRAGFAESPPLPEELETEIGRMVISSILETDRWVVRSMVLS